MVHEDDFELEADIEFDEVHIIEVNDEDLEIEIGYENELPNSYLFVENLILKQQVVGVVDKDSDLLVVPAYAMKDGTPKLVDYVELTADNITRMQLLGLTVTLKRKTKGDIRFDCAEDYVAIAKTLRARDMVDIIFDDVSDNPSWVERR